MVSDDKNEIDFADLTFFDRRLAVPFSSKKTYIPQASKISTHRGGGGSD